jgi:Transposase DDE domain
MYSSIRGVLAQFKEQWSSQLGTDDELEPLCRAVGLQWRKRVLTPLCMIRLFFLQILHGNIECDALPHLSGLRFTAGAYCTARQKLPLELFERLLARVTERLCLSGPLANADRWRGHRVFLLDGTGFSLPDTPALRQHYGYPPNQKPDCGFPVAYGLVLVHWGSGLIQRLATARLGTSELTLAPQVHPELQPGDVAVADALFGNYVQLALLSLRGVFGVLRLSSHKIVDFTPGRPHVLPEGVLRRLSPGRPRSRWLQALGVQDQLVDWFKPAVRPKWLSVGQWKSLPEVLRVRELRYRVDRPGFRAREITLITTLLDSQRYPREALAELYYQRWTIETNFRHLKITLGMDRLHCQTVAGVQKEMVMFCLVYNLVRLTMGLAAQAQRVPLDRISFKDALRWLLTAPKLDQSPRLIVNPQRNPRLEPRVLKRRQKRYPLLRQPRAQLRKAILLHHFGLN